MIDFLMIIVTASILCSAILVAVKLMCKLIDWAAEDDKHAKILGVGFCWLCSVLIVACMYYDITHGG